MFSNKFPELKKFLKKYAVDIAFLILFLLSLFFRVYGQAPVNTYRIRAVKNDSTISVSNVVSVNSIKKEALPILIYDLQGRLVSNNGIASSLAPGIYFVQYRNTRKKLIIR